MGAVACLAFMLTARPVEAVVLTWDADNSTTGPQDGSGTWTTGSAGWWNGTTGTNWVANDQAVFGAGTDGTYTITLGGAIAVASGSQATGGLNFLNSGYTLSAPAARTLTIGNSSATGFVRVAAGKVGTIGSNVTVQKGGGSGALALLGGGTLAVISGGTFRNTFVNASEVANGSTLWVNGGSVSYATSVVFGQLTSGFGTSGNLIVDSGTLAITSNNLVVSRATGDVSTATVNGGAITITLGGLNFGLSGITGTSTFNLNGGSVTVRQVNYFGGTATFNFNGGVLQSQTSGSAAFMGGLTRANVRNGGAVFDSNGQNITVSQSLLHSDIPGDNAIDGGLTLGGNGRLTLSGSNSYTGPTAVNTGTLAVNGVIGSGTVSVAAGAWLQGTGTIGGAVNVQGTLSPGTSPGVITLGSLTLGGSSTSLIEVTGTVRGSGYDGVNITGTSSPLTYAGVLSLSFGNVSAFANDTVFDIFNFSGGSLGSYTTVSSTGFYAGAWDDIGGGQFRLISGSQTLTFNQATGDIIVVPEPGAVALAGLGLAAGVAALRRCRKS
jgi:autotransporter-associated beta strand protein